MKYGSAGRRIITTLFRSLLQAIPTLFIIVILSFFLLRLAPGDAADAMAGEAGTATVEAMARWRSQFGLDLPMLEQLLNYLNNLAHFSLGYSPRYGVAVADLIGERLPGSLMLMGMAVIMAVSIGIAIGCVMASFAGRPLDRLLSVVALILYSIPGFWIGLMLVVVFSVHLGWLPSGGAETIGSDFRGLDLLLDRLLHMILPATALAMVYIAIYARLTRASMLEVRNQDYIRTAAAKGLSPAAITIRHILPNALLPVTTMIGLHIGTLLGGAVVVETIFSLPGLGRLAFEAIMRRDFSVLMGILLLSSVLVMITNILVDVLHAWLDPRIEPR